MWGSNSLSLNPSLDLAVDCEYGSDRNYGNRHVLLLHQNIGDGSLPIGDLISDHAIHSQSSDFRDLRTGHYLSVVSWGDQCISQAPFPVTIAPSSEVKGGTNGNR